METLDRLRTLLKPLSGALVAYSGGADSALVAWAAHASLGDRALAVTALSESLALKEAGAAAALARTIGIRHEEIAYSELAIPGYSDNPPDRCYLCKGALFRTLAARARELGLEVVLDGSNSDDLADYRPGRRAAAEFGVRSPLVELRLGKAEVREALRTLNLPVWDKPSSPCLSSRIPYGEPITREKLEQVAEAEAVMRDLGFREVRVRHHGVVARIEVPRSALSRLVAEDVADEVVRRLQQAGFPFVAVDLGGLRSGSLNRVLPAMTPGGHEDPGALG